MQQLERNLARNSVAQFWLYGHLGPDSSLLLVEKGQGAGGRLMGEGGLSCDCMMFSNKGQKALATKCQ